MANNESTVFMGPTALAKRYGKKTRKTIWRWSKLPGFPKPKGFGSRPLYPVRAVDRFLSQIYKVSKERKERLRQGE